MIHYNMAVLKEIVVLIKFNKILPIYLVIVLSCNKDNKIVEEPKVNRKVVCIII